MDSSPYACPTDPGRRAAPAWSDTAAAARRWFRGTCFALGALALAACGQNGPDLKAQFAAGLPDAWQMESFKVDAEDDVGTKVEPQRHYRFRAEVSPKADLYQSLGTLDGRAVLKRTARKGDKAPVLGTARSIFRADQWETAFAPEEAPNFFVGRPAEAHGAQQVVIGSSDYKRLVADARAALDKRAAQIAAEQTQWQTMVAEWNTLNQQVQEENRQSMEALNREHQRINQEQMALRNQAREENQAAEQALQATLKEKSVAPREELDARVAELDKDYRLKLAELQAQGKELQQAWSNQRRQLRDEHNADIAAARKRLNAADLTRYRASAEEALRTRQAEQETGFRERQTQLRDQQNALSDQRREQATQANAAYQEKIGAIRQELDASRKDTRDSVGKKTSEAIEALTAELQNKRQEHQAAVRANNEKLAAKRRETDQFAARIQQSRREGGQQEQLLTQLEAAED